MDQEKQQQTQEKQGATQAAQGAALSGMAGTHAGAAAGGAAGAMGGGPVGWALGMNSGVIVGLIIGMFLGLAIGKSNSDDSRAGNRLKPSFGMRRDGMSTKVEKTLRVGAIGLAMLYGSMAMAPATAAQDTEEPAAAAEDGGFDDWGLLGLLGLAGLAGLKRREPEVRTVDRTDRPAR